MARIRFLSVLAASVAVGLAFATPPPAAAKEGTGIRPIVGKSTTTFAPSFAAFEGEGLGINRLVLTEPTALVGNERLLARGSSKHEPTASPGEGGTNLAHPVLPWAPEVATAPLGLPGEGRTAKADGGTEIIESGGLT